MLNALSWLFDLTSRYERHNSVRLLIKKEKLRDAQDLVQPFADDVLKTDGILLLHFIKGTLYSPSTGPKMWSPGTAGAFVARDVCTQMFDAYKHSRCGKRIVISAAANGVLRSKPTKTFNVNPTGTKANKKRPDSDFDGLFHASFNESLLLFPKNSAIDSGFCREPTDASFPSDNSQSRFDCEAAGSNGLFGDVSQKAHRGAEPGRVEKKKKGRKSQENDDNEDWGAIGAYWDLD